MTNCAEIQVELSAYVDGELPAARRASFDDHLATCAACRQRAQELRQLAAGVKALPGLQPSPQFLREVRAKVSAARPEARSHKVAWWGLPVGAAAMIALLVTATVLMRTPSRRDAGQLPSKSFDGMILSEKESKAPAEEPARNLASDKDRFAKTTGEAMPAMADARSEIPAAGSLPVEEKSKLMEPPHALEKPSLRAAAAPPAAPVIVAQGRDAAAVRKQAEQLAQSLDGQVLNRAEADKVYVQLPANKVEEFRRRLGTDELAAAKRELGYSKTDSNALESFPQVVLQIQIVTNAAPVFAAPEQK